MQKQKIPQNVLQAVDALTSPYGVKLIPEPETREEALRRFFDVKAASRYSSLSRWTLSRAVKSGELKCSKIGSGQTGKILFDVKELDRYINSHAVSRKVKGGEK